MMSINNKILPFIFRKEMGDENEPDLEALQTLLKPIREPTAVWGINIQELLDTYLDQISKIEIDDNFTPDTLSFTRAGLLIQGSTNVLVKKIKHLYDLTLASTSTNYNDEGEEGDDKAKTKKKKKPKDWVVDDQLAIIDDPDTIENTTIVDDSPRYEITTIPKVPFCLLHSLDSTKSKGSSDSYRINNIPDNEHCVILLDSAEKFTDRNEAPDLSLQSTPSFASPAFQPDSQNSPQFLAPLPDREEEDYNEKKDETQRRDEDPEEIISQTENQTNSTFIENNDEEPKMLDPDSTENLSIILHPFKKMSSIKIPTEFPKEKTEEQSKTEFKEDENDIGKENLEKFNFKKPFHNDIFADIFKNLQILREKRLHEEDENAIAQMPESQGREHLLENMDVYIEQPELPDISDDDNDKDGVETIEPIDGLSTQDPLDISKDYEERSRRMIKEMIEEGKKHIKESVESNALSQWEKKVTPVLELELQRKPFNVGECRAWILKMLVQHETNGKMEISFHALTNDMDTREVSRIFLSTLMLANAGDIEIFTSKEMPEGDFLIIAKGSVDKLQEAATQYEGSVEVQ